MSNRFQQGASIQPVTLCKSVRNAPPNAPLIPWKWPTRPFQRIHIDFFQKGNDHFLVAIDSNSRTQGLSKEDRRFLNIAETDIHHSDNSHHEVPLPLKASLKGLLTNKNDADCQLF